LIDREESSCYYLPLTPRVSLSPSPQSAVQVSMSMITGVKLARTTAEPSRSLKKSPA